MSNIPDKFFIQPTMRTVHFTFDARVLRKASVFSRLCFRVCGGVFYHRRRVTPSAVRFMNYSRDAISFTQNTSRLIICISDFNSLANARSYECQLRCEKFWKWTPLIITCMPLPDGQANYGKQNWYVFPPGTWTQGCSVWISNRSMAIQCLSKHFCAIIGRRRA